MAQYRFQELTVQDGRGDVNAHGINDRGDVVVSYLTKNQFDPYPDTAIDHNGTVTKVPLNNPGEHDGYGINNLGDVAGSQGDAMSGISGFLWSPDGMVQTIGQPIFSALFDNARGVNDFKQVVGTDYAGHHLGFLWQNGQMSFIQYPGAAFTDATGISDTGIIVGSYSAGIQPDGSFAPNHAFVDVRGHMSTIAIPGAVSAQANGISLGGLEICGTYQGPDGHSHGWTDVLGHVSTFDLPGATTTEVYAVNDFGQLVGTYATAVDQTRHGFVATPDNERLGSGPLRNVLYYDPTQPVLSGTS